MPIVTAAPLEMTAEQRAELERMARSTSLPLRKVVQARALVLAADGVATNEVARRCQTTNESVRAWRRRFEREGVEGVGRVAPGRGRKPWLPEGTVTEVVRVTREERPDDDATHWTTRTLADRFGIGKDTVARIWRDHGLKPWRVENFKLSNDPRFEEKLTDVVGLYLNPPVRHEAPVDRVGMKGLTCGPSQRSVEAGSSLNLEAQGRVGAAPTTTGRAGTARRSGSGKQDGKVYARNQRLNPL